MYLKITNHLKISSTQKRQETNGEQQQTSAPPSTPHLTTQILRCLPMVKHFSFTRRTTRETFSSLPGSRTDHGVCLSHCQVLSTHRFAKRRYPLPKTAKCFISQ